MTMKITGGALKNFKLKAPVGFRVRPTPAKVREALFSIMGEKVEGSRFLDFFAGSGAVGIEAASRGAVKVTFVESKKSAIKVLRSNLEGCRLDEMATVIHFDVFDTIITLNNRQLFFDIVFLDPPYEGDLLIQALKKMIKYPIIEPGAIVITQSYYKTVIPPHEKLQRYQHKTYGETTLSFFTWEGV
ncbi:16S rRNA (guanine(966)-N(2))-methyltransferase RsmD [candidate division CSSED10-310 bacterium]|uniref:16S rRNA (Guanine(966)-N(2))-methyltransferase RsmD n=1 Tax=candidate division CSSED10-310 bacterium TaxID=2855610 RepID=A0ABV6YTB2_UNCC1